MNSSSRNYSAGALWWRWLYALCTTAPAAERAIRLHRKISLYLFQAFTVFEKKFVHDQRGFCCFFKFEIRQRATE